MSDDLRHAHGGGENVSGRVDARQNIRPDWTTCWLMNWAFQGIIQSNCVSGFWGWRFELDILGIEGSVNGLAAQKFIPPGN